MSVSIIIGGQFGSEGKGKTALLWAKKMNAKACVRVGGTNAGHTVYDEAGKRYAFRILPTAAILNSTVCVLPAGSYIEVDVLQKEIALSGLNPSLLKIDDRAVVIDSQSQELEKAAKLRDYIGSTLSGTGGGVLMRVARDTRCPAKFAKDIPELKQYLCNTKAYLRDLIDEGSHVVIEGTQGYGLSNIHSSFYPYATSRDTTAAGFLMETGLSPFDVEHIVMTIRAFPIRVAGNSGPLEQEISWEIVSEESGNKAPIIEYTTVTQKVRRVARFTPDIVKEAIIANKPDTIVLNHVDYIDAENKRSEKLTEKQISFVKRVEREIGQKIDFCGNGEMSLIATGDM